MGHNISGIITSFKYNGDLAHTYLVGNYALLPLNAHTNGFRDSPVKPFEELTPSIVKLAKDLSWHGKVAFVETSYHGGRGSQASIVWDSGRCVLGALFSCDYEVSAETLETATLVERSINEALKFIGIYKHDDKFDEFHTARLTGFRDNEDIFQEISRNQEV